MASAKNAYQAGVVMEVAETGGQEFGINVGNHIVSDPAADMTGLPINVFNEAEAVAERENEMGNHMSESTYETLRDLQDSLREMKDQFRKNCCK